jgi:hypothetical protein
VWAVRVADNGFLLGGVPTFKSKLKLEVRLFSFIKIVFPSVIEDM